MKRYLLAGGLISLLILFFGIFHTRNRDETTGLLPPPSRIIPQQSSARTNADLTLRDHTQDHLIRTEWATLLAWLDGSPPPTPEEIRTRLRDLRSAWAQFDPHLLAATLDALLQSQVNRPTGLTFAVGPQGFLAGWPDIRTFLVDALAMADPEESAKIARTILRETNSAAEYAIAIRSLIRTSAEQATSSELLSAFQTLLSRQHWQGDAAMAESLDLARYLGTREAASALLHWNGSPQARSMALHEFAADHPAIMIATLSEAAADSSAETTSLWARADPADPAQAAAIDTYLRNPAIPVAQRETFLSLYPLRSLTTGYRLYRGNPAPYDENGIRRSDAAALAQAESWLRDPDLVSLRESLTAWKTRLLEWQKTGP